MDEVMKLVAERAKYEKFLAELDKDAASKPANVVARVRADYTTKLEAVTEKLKASHDVLTEHAATLTTQLQKLQDAEKRFEDEAAELDLRKQVGEIPEEEWATAVERVKADASKIKKQQELTADEIKQIRDMLGSAVAAKAEAAPPQKDVDELEFLKTVVGPTTGAIPKAQRPSAAPPTPRPSANVKPIGPPPRPSTTSTPAPRPSVVARERLIEPDPMDVELAPPAEAPAAKPAKRPTPAKESLIAEPQSEIKIQPKAAKPLASNVPDGEMDLKPAANSTAVKKTKCPKCRGLNIPSDWYCVHCGAELAI